MKQKEFFLTSEGYLELETELNYLKTDKRNEVLNTLKEARALGDLSENAEYDNARDEQGKLEARIKEIEFILEHASIIEDEATESGVVSIGSTVSLQYDGDDEVEEYRIVGSQEADPFNNKISNESPIGAALLGAKKGEDVETGIEITLEEAFYGKTKKISLRTVSGNLKTITVKVPAGIRNKERIRLIGQGKPAENGGKTGEPESRDHGCRGLLLRDGSFRLLLLLFLSSAHQGIMVIYADKQACQRNKGNEEFFHAVTA